AFFHVTLQNLVGVLSTPEQRPRNFSNFSMTGAITNFSGPLIAGFSIDHYGHAVAALIVVCFSATGLVALALGWRLLPRPRPPRAPAPAAPVPGDTGVWR